MRGDVELFESIIKTADGWTVQAPLYRVDGGPYRRIANGVCPSRIIKVEPMDEWRQSVFMAKARAMAVRAR